MTATLRQARIPDLQDFTHNYNRDKIFEFDLNRLSQKNIINYED